ncbi:MAG: hypothetical protein K2M27_06215 [Muribaculaceae bacterium]|nr:hypothetical protein [Muribaculaceae bacterium]
MDAVLDSAGENRVELERVLDYFKGVPFKYDAACFLISNMSGKHHYVGWQLDSLKAVKPLGRMDDEELSRWDGFDFRKDCRKVMDVKTVDAEVLIENIELACEVWLSRPWHGRYSFNDFCEYVLPYKVGDEPPERWRKLWYDRYAPLMDSILSQTTDIVEVASMIADRLKSEGFDNHDDVDVPHFGASFLMGHRVGYCRENCDIAAYAMRSLGIPVATDRYVTSPSYNSRHFWSALIDTTGLAVPFNYTERSISRTPDPQRRKMGKVYRRFYGKQGRKSVHVPDKLLPKLFRDPHTRDVSEEYFPDSKPVTVAFPDGCGVGYLCVYNGTRFDAIDVAAVKDYKGVFRYIEDGVLLFPTVYENGKMRPCGYPLLTGRKTHRRFIPDKGKRGTVVLNRKYPMVNTGRFLANIIGGRIEASADIRFICPTLVAEFTDTARTNRLIYQPNLKGVRYIRYVAPSDRRIEIGEMHFYNKGEEIRPCKITPDRELDSIHIHNFKLITDNVWHSFYLSQEGEVLTFDFGKPVDMDRVLFVPRNDDNFVREGQDYELFFHDGELGWRSLERKTALADSIGFDHVPGNAVLWLHDYSGGKEERPFYIEDGRQVFI